MSQSDYTALIHEGTAGAALIFAFHGTGGRAQEVFALARQIAPEATVIAPEGDVSEHGAARFFRRTGEGVYDMDDLAARTEKMASFIAANKAARPGRPVHAFGYSNGANILASVMMAQPDLIDRAGLLHPLIPWRPEPVPGLNGREVLITAGQRDPICPWSMTEDLIDWFKDQGATVSTEVHGGGHELRPQEFSALAALLTPQIERVQ